MTHLIKKEKQKEKLALKRAGLWLYYWLGKVVHVITKSRKCRVIMFKIDVMAVNSYFKIEVRCSSIV